MPAPTRSTGQTSTTPCVVAAVLTPPDVISQFALAIPTLLLYEASILSVRMVERKRAEADAARAAAG